MKKILLIGAGGHCKSCIDVIEQLGLFEIAGIIDNAESVSGQVLDYPIIGTDIDLFDLRNEFEYAFVTVGQLRSAELKIRLYNTLKKYGYKIPTLISPLAYVSKYAQIGSGTIVMHHALVNTNARIGINCIINTKALVEHDAQIGDHCHISTSAVINGGVVVGHSCFIGSNATTKQYCQIKDYEFIKANSLFMGSEVSNNE